MSLSNLFRRGSKSPKRRSSAGKARSASVQAYPELDKALKELNKYKDEWANTSITERVDLLKEIQKRFFELKDEWAEAAVLARGVKRDDPAFDLKLTDEAGATTWAVARMLEKLIECLAPAAKAERKGSVPTFGPKLKTSKRHDGTHVVQVLPSGPFEQAQFPQFKCEVWIQPGREPTRGQVYRERFDAKGKRRTTKQRGSVCLVLGAGNVNSIPLWDTMSKMFQENAVVILKMNPILDYSLPYINQVMAPLIERGFFAAVSGGAAEGSFLTSHRMVDHMHITGSQAVYNRIVWGPPDDQEKNKANGTPLVEKRFTSELGCVTCFTIVPGGEWSSSDIKYQVQSFAGGVTQNNSFNCISHKVLLMPKNWQYRAAFMEELRRELGATPSSPAYYPGALDRMKQWRDVYPSAVELNEVSGPDHLAWTMIPELSVDRSDYDPLCTTTESFCSIFADMVIDEDDPERFMERATRFLNDELEGDLSTTVAIHPKVQDKHKAAFERMIERLRYGTVAINVPGMVAFPLGTPVWGAHFGNTPADVGSGTGFVHNAYMIDYPLKQVLRGPWRLPVGIKPPWSPAFHHSVGLTRAWTRTTRSKSVGSLSSAYISMMRG